MKGAKALSFQMTSWSPEVTTGHCPLIRKEFIMPPRLIVILVAASLFSSQANAADLRVYFLVGQSNMEGKGNPIHLDTYKSDPMIAPTYASLKDGDGWRVRDDVWITYPSKARGGPLHGPLTVGYGTKGEDSIGPEFGFGHAVGNSIDDPVLLIKIAWGGKSLAVDFRPPSLPPEQAEVDRLLERARRKNPETPEAEVRERFGYYYREMLRHAKEELANVGERFPELASHEPVISGFIWHQGFNDKVQREQKATRFAEYSERLIAFIKDVRHDLNAPGMPFIIGELSTGGIPQRGDFQVAQQKAAAHPEFAGNVTFVPTAEYYDTAAHELYEKKYWKGTHEQKAEWQKVGNDRPYHYLGSGKTYYLKGVAFGEAVVKLAP